MRLARLARTLSWLTLAWMGIEGGVAIGTGAGPGCWPGMLARRHLEVCVFSHLVAELRSGDIAVVGSESYANLHSQLISWEQCEPHVAEFCRHAGIPADAKALVAHYRALLTRTASAVDRGIRRTPTCAWRAASRCWYAAGG